MFLSAFVSELVSERTFVSMMEDLWVFPFLVALYALPSRPNPWLSFVSISHHLFESVRFIDRLAGLAYWTPLLSVRLSSSLLRCVG